MAAGTEQGHGQAGQAGRSGEEDGCGRWGRQRGWTDGGVSAQPLLPERSLWLAADWGSEGPPGSSGPSLACPRRPVDSGPGLA